MSEVIRLLRNGTPETLCTNLLEKAQEGVFKEIIMVCLDKEGNLSFHWTTLSSNLMAVGMVEALKQEFL